MSPPVALTIAGSDSSGGAGIEADLATFAALGVHGTAAVTALTAQNTLGVHGVVVTEVDFVGAQIDAVVDDLPVASVKTGMLATEEIVQLVASHAAAGRLPNLVVDPVMVSSTGDRLLTEGAERSYVDDLLPLARVVTPNLREASVLIGRTLTTAADVHHHGAALAALCPDGYVVVTGGHVSDEEAAEHGAVDVVLHGGERTEVRSPWVATENDHGTGCTFASAVAARLASGDHPLDAITAAKDIVAERIERSARWQLGHGRGPVAHTC